MSDSIDTKPNALENLKPKGSRKVKASNEKTVKSKLYNLSSKTKTVSNSACSSRSVKPTKTPKGQIGGKKVLRAVQQTVVTPVLRKRVTKGHLKCAQPNLEDVSPIIGSTKQMKCEKKNLPGQKRRRGQSNDGVRDLRSAKKITQSVIETPPVSFSVSKCDFNDSAIFLEPKANLFQSTKTSTPTISSKAKKSKQKNFNKKKNLCHKPVVTSTPNEIKPHSTYTKLKKKTQEVSPAFNQQQSTESNSVSPIVRGETPTSDYASMDSVDLIPSPSPLKQPATMTIDPAPAFSLDDDLDMLNLNKSFEDRSYNHSAKRIKKKFVSDKRRESIIDEWAEKVNSELEDIENFELSVEG